MRTVLIAAHHFTLLPLQQQYKSRHLVPQRFEWTTGLLFLGGSVLPTFSSTGLQVLLSCSGATSLSGLHVFLSLDLRSSPLAMIGVRTRIWVLTATTGYDLVDAELGG
jgi:predicted membrane chloride channel (bestrophin family)